MHVPRDADGLSPAELVRLIGADIRDASGVVRVGSDLQPEAYSASTFLSNAQIMMRAIAQDPPKATKTLGNLERAFVRKMFYAMTWPEEYRELVEAHVKVFDEEQLTQINVVRVVLELARLVKKRKGRFYLTKRGETLAAESRTGQLYEKLFRTFFGTFNLAYLSHFPSDPALQDRFVAVLWHLRALPPGSFCASDLVDYLPTSRDMDWVRPYWTYEEAREFAIATEILEPLRAFGLVTLDGAEEAPAVRRGVGKRWSLTSNFDKLITLDLEPDMAPEDEVFVPSEMIDTESAVQRFLHETDAEMIATQRDSARMIADTWLNFLDREGPETLEGWERERFRIRPGKKPRRFTSHFGPEFAIRLAGPFVDQAREKATSEEMDVAVFASLVIQAFARWCAERGLVAPVVLVEDMMRNEAFISEIAASVGAGEVPLLADMRVVRLKVTLADVKPMVWRRIEVWDDVTMGELHAVINAVMGWTDSHLHRFEIGLRTIGIPNDFGFPGEEDEDEEEVLLCDLLDEGVSRFTYLYDFGDGWTHRVVVESVLEPEDEIEYPRCIDGRNACPPEDVGGIPGYQAFVKSMQAPDDRDEDGFRRWYGGTFDPHAFDVAEADREVRQRHRRWQAEGLG